MKSKGLKMQPQGWDTSISQTHDRNSHLTLTEHKKQNFQNTEKTSENAHYTGSFISFKHLNKMP